MKFGIKLPRRSSRNQKSGEQIELMIDGKPIDNDSLKITEIQVLAAYPPRVTFEVDAEFIVQERKGGSGCSFHYLH